ncbi:hypothetical protein NQZ68_013450 [Dissostichus eleginoides]|nr:hypothetical protein NQZ68_013450 [Dissostichus eleginoides]
MALTCASKNALKHSLSARALLLSRFPACGLRGFQNRPPALRRPAAAHRCEGGGRKAVRGAGRTGRTGRTGQAEREQIQHRGGGKLHVHIHNIPSRVTCHCARVRVCE